MKKISLALSLVVITLLSTFTASADSFDHKKGKKVLRHVVCFKFKEGTTDQQIKGIVEEFKSLKTKISAIHKFEWGINNSKEGFDKGFTHCFTLTFKSAADFEAYVPHKDHQAFASNVGEVVEDVFVVDYWTSE
ncbi:MAG: Dabb family protein [Cyclobacteriaceae bacterium]